MFDCPICDAKIELINENTISCSEAGMLHFIIELDEKDMVKYYRFDAGNNIAISSSIGWTKLFKCGAEHTFDGSVNLDMNKDLKTQLNNIRKNLEQYV